MIKKTITILFFVFSFYVSQAQYTFQHIFKSPLNQDIGTFVELNNDYIFFPILSTQPINETKIIKINNRGEIEDSITINEFSNIFYKMIKYDDNSFFIAGCKYGNIDDTFCLRKYDFNLNLLSEISVSVKWKIEYFDYISMIINSNKNLVVSVFSTTNAEQYNNIFEVNSECQILKSEIIEAWGACTTTIIQKNNYYYFFVYGWLYEKTSMLSCFKLDSAFNNLGRVFSGYPDILEDFNNTKWINDSIFLLSGKNYNNYGYPTTQVLKMKIDTSFQILKSFTLSKNDSAICIGLIDNLSLIDVNNIFLGSWSYKYFLNDTTNQFILTKLDSGLNVKWVKKYGGDAVYYLNNIKATQDGGCIMNGYSYNYQNPSNLFDPFIIKVDSLGGVAWVHNLPSSFMKINVYPNPGSDKLTVNNPPQNTSLVLYNTQGQTIITQSLNQSNSLNTSSLQSGVYFYRLIDSKGKVLGSGKWVKVGE